MVAFSCQGVHFKMVPQHALVTDTFPMLTAMQRANSSCLTTRLFSMPVASISHSLHLCKRRTENLFMLTACLETRRFARKLQSGASMKGEYWSSVGCTTTWLVRMSSCRGTESGMTLTSQSTFTSWWTGGGSPIRKYLTYPCLVYLPEECAVGAHLSAIV